MTKKKADKLTINEKDDNIEIVLNMTSLIPCVNAIKQYNGKFNANDIMKDSHFRSSVLDDITEYFNGCLYEIIDKHDMERRYDK